MKQRLHSYKMSEDKDILSQLEEFHKILDELETIEDKNIADDDKAILLLNSLPRSYTNIKDAMVFGRK